MLIENAIKHNTISNTAHMTIDIKSVDGSYLEITNTKKIKKYIGKKRKGTGLDNIKSRYNYFTDHQIIISDEATTFSVKLPLLVIE